MARAPLDIGRLSGSALRSLVDGVPHGLLVVDQGHAIRYLNRAAADLLGAPPERLVGTAFTVPLASSESVELDPGGGAPTRLCQLDVRSHRMSGEVVFLVSLREIGADERARREAEADADAKTALLATIAHEFRNPLGTIVGCLSMLGEATFEGRPEQRHRLVEMSQRKARDLQRLVDDLLTSARIETGRLQPSPRSVDLRTVVDGAVERAQGRAELLGADVHLVRPVHAVAAVLDPDQVGIALDNLINNAFTYSEGSPWVEVRLDAGTGVEATITVTDHGVGIEEIDQARIFAPFERASDGKRRAAGTGLGLAIARGMADINGGRLELVSSRPGAGSRFALHLPAAAT